MSTPIKSDRIARYAALIERERETLEEFAVRIAEGESLAAICKAWDVPAGRLGAWIASDQRRQDIYEGARKLKADALADEMLEIADREGDDVQQKALEIRARQWVAARWDRARYGDAVVVEHTGETVVRLSFGERTLPALAGESSAVDPSEGEI